MMGTERRQQRVRRTEAAAVLSRATKDCPRFTHTSSLLSSVYVSTEVLLSDTGRDDACSRTGS